MNKIIHSKKPLSKIEIRCFHDMEKQLSNILSEQIVGLDEVQVCCYLLGTTYCSLCLDYCRNYSKLITDSKLLTISQINKAFEELMDKALDIGLGFATVNGYDLLGSGRVQAKARLESINTLSYFPKVILADYYKVGIPVELQIVLPRGDERFLCTSGASIIAKYVSNKICEEVHKDYPQYKLNSNHGGFVKGTEKLIIEHGFIKGMARKSWCSRFIDKCKIIDVDFDEISYVHKVLNELGNRYKLFSKFKNNLVDSITL